MRALTGVELTPLTVELLTLLDRNPTMIDSTEGFAAWLGRSPQVIRAGLEHLVEAGLLSPLGSAHQGIYRYTRDQQRRDAVRQFLRAANVSHRKEEQRLTALSSRAT